MEYLTKYPKTISLVDGIREIVKADSKSGVEHLYVVVKHNIDDLVKMFKNEGFTKVKFEHKKPFQIGHGLNMKLKKPWEMHVRFVELVRLNGISHQIPENNLTSRRN